MLPTISKEKIMTKFERFRRLSYPDRELTKEIMNDLRIYDIVDLEIALNKKIPRERLAALKMVERHIDALLSGSKLEWAEAKDTLRQIYYAVEEMEEEGYL